MSLSVAIAGASGYAGGELARLVAAHPEFELTTLSAHSSSGQSVGSVHPHLVDYAHQEFRETSVETLSGHDVIALALPHGQSGLLGQELIDSGATRLLLDLSADRRLESPTAWAKFYGGDFFEPFTYGMPELPRATGPTSRELLTNTEAVAIPGCNATAVTLALAPLVAARVIQPTDLSAVLAVGSSGAGRTPRVDLLGSELSGSANAYSVGGAHRHIPEIIQNLHHASGLETTLSMTAVLVPMSRGILATCSAVLSGDQRAEDIHELMTQAYAGDPCVVLRPLGSFPKTGDVMGSNTIALGVAVDHSVNRVMVIAAIDNLVKGTAGAAIQSMNLAFGFNELLGLSLNGLAP